MVLSLFWTARCSQVWPLVSRFFFPGSVVGWFSCGSFVCELGRGGLTLFADVDLSNSVEALVDKSHVHQVLHFQLRCDHRQDLVWDVGENRRACRHG